MTEFLVEHDYKAQEDDELTLRKGDIIRNCRQTEEGWMQGELCGRTGCFPDNFGKIVEKLPSANLSHDVGHSSTNSTTSTSRGRVVQPNICKNREDLNLPIGTLVDILDDSDPKYFRVRTDSNGGSGREGRVLRQCIERISSTSSVSKKALGEEVGTGGRQSQGGSVNKPVGAVGFGNIFAENKPFKLRPVTKTISEDATPAANHSVALETTVGASTTSSSKPAATAAPGQSAPPLVSRANKPNLERARVLYPYKAANEDELSLSVGEIILVLEKECEDEGWWRGELNGKEGLFPDNFVAVLPAPGSSGSRENLHADTGYTDINKTNPVKNSSSSNRFDSDLSTSNNQFQQSINSGLSTGGGGGGSLVHVNRPKQPGKRKPTKSIEELNCGPGAHTVDLDDSMPMDSVDDYRGGKKAPPRPIGKPHSAAANVKPFGSANLVTSTPLGGFDDSSAESPRLNGVKSMSGNGVVVGAGSSTQIMPSSSSFNSKQANQIAELIQQIAELNLEIRRIKETTVPRVEYDKFKLTQMNRMESLMKELDEEKKQHLSNKVELDRIRSLVVELDSLVTVGTSQVLPKH